MNLLQSRMFHRLSVLLLSSLIITACGSEKMAALPDPPTSAKQVDAFVKGKNYDVVKVGFYGMLTVNDKSEMEWIDTTVTKDGTTLSVMRELDEFELHLGTDTTATVISKGNSFPATWLIDDKEDSFMNEAKGIRLRVAYTDPDFSFGGNPTKVTFSYVVKGINENEILLELPRDINRRKLVALMKAK
ncbi:MAG: hypothetical protein NVV59_01400 [Chitinophagaceae bacterium]|nr:hypothetical protein [Chitinophagaceae bacterium]